MNATFVERQSGLVLGLLTRIDPMRAPFAELWGAYMARDPAIAPLAVDGSWYGIYYGTDEPGKVDLLIGRQVAEGVVAPEGLTLRPLAGGTYATFECPMAAVGQTWREIYGQWLPSSGLAIDPSRPAFEHYRPTESGGEPQVRIFVPVHSLEAD